MSRTGWLNLMKPLSAASAKRTTENSPAIQRVCQNSDVSLTKVLS